MADTIKLNIEGMTCGHCQSAVKNALARTTGVEHVDVNLEEGVAVVEGPAQVNHLITAVEEEGYKASLAQV